MYLQYVITMELEAQDVIIYFVVFCVFVALFILHHLTLEKKLKKTR